MSISPWIVVRMMSETRLTMRREAGTLVFDAATSYEQSPWKQGLDQSFAACTLAAVERTSAR
jgi:hypothetical protein